MNSPFRMKNAVKEYKKKGFASGRGLQGAFYIEDVYTIKELSTGADGQIDIINLIINALMGGFITGYKSAKREIKKP